MRRNQTNPHTEKSLPVWVGRLGTRLIRAGSNTDGQLIFEDDASSDKTMQASPEYRALGQASNLLRTSINPDDIVALLFDNQLLTRDERHLANARHLIPQQRMGEVYSALERRVGISPEPFHKFVRILIGVPALKPVAKQLYDLYLKEGGTRQEYAAQFEAPVQPTRGRPVCVDA